MQRHNIVRKDYDEVVKERILIIKQQEVIKKSGLLTGQWVEIWLLNYHKADVSTSTFETLESILKCHIKPDLGDIGLQKLTTNRLQSFIVSKLSSLSPAYVKKTMSLINGALTQAEKEGLILKNPVTDTKIPQPKSKVGKAYSDKEITKLMKVAKDHYLYPALILALSTGMRRGEILGLTWDKIDFKKKEIEISVNYVKTKTGGELRESTKTDGSTAKISVDDFTLSVLAKMERRSNVVFSDKNGNYIRPLNLQRLFNTWKTEAGVKGRFHDLRHTFATNILNDGTPLHVAMSLTRHATSGTLIDTYGHLLKKTQSPAIKRLGKKIKDLDGTK